MKKKILLALLVVSMLVCLFAITSSATEVNGIYYTFSETNGVCTASLNSKNVNCQLEIVNIPETVEYNGKTYTVTKLESSAFGGGSGWPGNKVAKEITVPKTVSSIGTHCFRNCTNLTKVTILASAGSFTFSNAEFYNCSSLKTVDMSQATGLKSIGEYAFTNCSSLETVLLPEGLEKITSSSFSGLSKLTTVTFPSTLKEISGKQAFASTALTNVYLPSGLEKLGNNIFQFAKVETVIIPSTVTSVGEHCFNNTKSLKCVVIANPDVTNYNNAMFYESSVDLIFFAGTEADARTFAGRLSKATFTNFISYDTYLNDIKNDPTKTYKDTIVYGTRNCECGNLANDEVKFQFTDYLSGMQDAISCTCGKTTVVESYAPIMEFVGYSAKINGNRICIGYTINHESLAVFTEKTNKALTFGVTAAIVDDSTTQYKTLEDDLTPINDKTVVASVDGKLAGFDFILSGFTSAHYEKSLVMCAFVYDGSKIIYIDNGGCNEYATPVTFNSVAK